ncbi:hypothetical protein BCR34DRAFT_188678 [Clohesyomyces aquaticus]|uniref:Uncharacterized protein n=1 Tax=Clohesyomyces aquaticus TaxID=1231657 RepID=A0A1Y1ZXX7_9PLEO|nr:hypothetical protein BCR34DRAFT_188678 [Clohesyomyces aquaticus]
MDGTPLTHPILPGSWKNVNYVKETAPEKIFTVPEDSISSVSMSFAGNPNLSRTVKKHSELQVRGIQKSISPSKRDEGSTAVNHCSSTESAPSCSPPDPQGIPAVSSLSQDGVSAPSNQCLDASNLPRHLRHSPVGFIPHLHRRDEHGTNCEGIGLLGADKSDESFTSHTFEASEYVCGKTPSPHHCITQRTNATTGKKPSGNHANTISMLSVPSSQLRHCSRFAEDIYKVPHSDNMDLPRILSSSKLPTSSPSSIDKSMHSGQTGEYSRVGSRHLAVIVPYNPGTGVFERPPRRKGLFDSDM